MLITRLRMHLVNFKMFFLFFSVQLQREPLHHSLHLRQICFEFVTGEMKCDLKTNCCHSTLVLQPKCALATRPIYYKILSAY